MHRFSPLLRKGILLYTELIIRNVEEIGLYNNRLREYIMKKYIGFIVSLSCLLASGCQTEPSPNETNATSSTVKTIQPLPSNTYSSVQSSTQQNIASENSQEGIVSVCQRELLALSKVNQNAYAQKKVAFENLLNSASIYTAVRNDIGGSTKDTMDSLYKYKTQKLCSDIEQAVRQSLISRGENIK